MISLIRSALFCLAVLALTPPAYATGAGPTPVSQMPPALSPVNPAYSIPSPSDNKQDKSADDADPLKNPIFLSLSKALQNQIMDEAHSFNRVCKGKSVYSVFHNCDCLALHFMNERIRHPDYSTQQISDTIDLDCVDKPSIAGYSYAKCVDIYSSSDSKILKPLCECYASAFANAYAKNPSVIIEYQVSLGVRTYMQCREKVTSMIPDNQMGVSSMPSAQ